ncbi:low-density lipoprotein receptor class A domain-containing protein 2 [Amblyraja radiata]|uniref:low-density lipoprotein receptor class A domain-containing protein 2 n=1 Tax=Amblyraja radiata TaxID=386614 RepID=UPI00140419D5|nr:low-density lipoprotein receptor class A domain-containing protein 2 [Amblyraja radiata]
MERKLGTFLQPVLFLMLNVLSVNPIQTVNLVDFCGQTIRADGIVINSHQEAQKYYYVTVGTDCGFTMQAALPMDKVQFQFRYFLVYSLLRESSIFHPTTASPQLPGQRAAMPLGGEEIADTCNDGSYVQFYDGKDRTYPPITSLLCGKSIPKPISSTGNYLSLRLVTRGQQPRVEFVGHFMSYRPGNFTTMPTPNETSTSTMEQINSPSPSINLSSLCQTPRRHHHPLSNNILYPDSAADNKSYVSLLTLYIILGVVAGAVLLFWCCWSPGWLVWRLSVCRFVPCCNSFCTACQPCCRTDKNRLAKVTPQSTVPVPV